MYKINDIGDSVCTSLLKLTDDTKVLSIVSDVNDVNELHNDLMYLRKWFQDWLMVMLFNVDKCKVVHIGIGIFNKKAK